MRLVIDTNRIIAALIKDSTTRRIILTSGIRFITVGLSLKEIEKYRCEILTKAGIDGETFDEILSDLFEKIDVVDDVVIEKWMKMAREIMDSIDADDTKFVALALSVENDGIWSEDEHFFKQKVIKTWRTAEVLAIV